MPAQQLRSVAALLLLSASASLGAEIITLHKYDSASARCGEVGVDVADVPNAKKDEPELMEGSCASAGYAVSQGLGLRFQNGTSYPIYYFVEDASSNSVLHMVSDSSGRCGQVVINSDYVDNALAAFKSLKEGPCGASGYELFSGTGSLAAQGLTFPIEYYWRRGSSSILHAISAFSGRCGQVVINASQTEIAKQMDHSLSDGSCYNAGYALPQGLGSKEMAGETFQVRYFTKSDDVAVLFSVDAASARCGHFSIAKSDVAAAKKFNPSLSDGTCEQAGYSHGDGTGSETQQGVNVDIDYFLADPSDSVLVHSVSDVSGLCGAFPLNATIAEAAMGEDPRLQLGGCLANDYVHRSGEVRQDETYGYTFDVSFYAMTGRSTHVYSIGPTGRCGSVTIQTAYIDAARKSVPSLSIGHCELEGYTEYDGVGHETFVGEEINVIYFKKPTSTP